MLVNTSKVKSEMLENISLIALANDMTATSVKVKFSLLPFPLFILYLALLFPIAFILPMGTLSSTPSPQ